ncbi:MAG: hypothetical protein JWN86_1647 [Planctomycetota bacterium]|nr:hypothetical protein [Planctomycetota bacterium]
MEVSPTGAPSTAVPPHLTDPVALLQLIANLQSQNLEIQRQVFEMQKQQLELTREAAQFNRDQRARQIAELERWQQAHEPMLDFSKQSLTQLEEVHAALMRELADYVDEHHENLVDGDFALSDFVDKFGPKLAHLNTMLAVLRPLAAAAKKAEGTT